MLYRTISLIISISLNFSPPIITQAMESDSQVVGAVVADHSSSFTTKAEHAVLIDHNKGITLYNKQASVPMTPSSMSKLMTTYIVFQHLKAGHITLQDEFTVSEKAWRMGGSRMFLNLGSKVSVEDLLLGIIVQSGNDACITIAEGLAGDEQSFAALMNKVAQDIGLTNSFFKNSTGWPEHGHYMSALDIAKLSSKIIKDFPEYYHYFGIKEFRYNNINQNNRNTLIGINGADGLKTGYTEAGGYGVAISAEKDSRRLIAVVNGLKTHKERIEEAERLLTYGFRSFKLIHLFKKGDKIHTINLWYFSPELIDVIAQEDIEVLVPVSIDRQNLKIILNYNQSPTTPIKAGQSVATLMVLYNDEEIKTAQLVSATDANFSYVKKWTHNLKHILRMTM